MKRTHGKKSMTLGKLTMYLNDLVKMGLVSEHVDDDGKQFYKLTKLGEMSGLEGWSK